MSIRSEAQASVGRFAPNNPTPDTAELDESGHRIVALLERAAATTKADCARAMDLAHKLTLQLRATEERVRELEAESGHFRDRAVRAEDWLQHIHREVEQTFFQEKEAQPSTPKRKK
jgi:hypothetical protein